MPKESAGLLLFRRRAGEPEVFLVHPGGPFWAKKDEAAWSIPKGELSSGEEPLAAAKREFAEETGIHVDGEFVALGEVKQAGGKVVKAWALEHDLNPSLIRSNTFEIEWPPRTGKLREFPEVDKAEWFALAGAFEKILKGQQDFLSRLAAHMSQAQS